MLSSAAEPAPHGRASTQRTTWRDQLYGLRDRLLASPDFRRRVTAIPIIRHFAQKNARDAFDLCAGFVYSQVLYACVELELFEILAKEPLTVEALSRRLSLPPDAVERLLTAGVSLRLLSQRSGARYGLGMLGAALIDNPGVAAMVRHHALLYRDMADPVALLRAKRGDAELAQFWRYVGSDSPAELSAAEVSDYSALMAVSQIPLAEEVLAAYSVRQHRRLLDVGGGEGGFATRAAAQAPGLQITLFDLPAVAARAEVHFREAGLNGRVHAKGGDFLAESLPRGNDLATLIRVLFDHEDSGARKILRRVRESLTEDGTLLIAEPMSGTAGAQPIGDAYFGFFLWAMGRGRPRTFKQHKRLLNASGFSQVREVSSRQPLLVRLIVARP